MKLTALQQEEIRKYLEKVIIVRSNCEELFDHIITGLEQRPDSDKLDIEKVKQSINVEFDVLINTEQEKRNYRRINTIIGFTLFFFAFVIYWLTMEPTVSF